MKDQLLIPEIKRIYEELSKIEKDMSPDEKAEKHKVFRDTALQIMQLSSVARREGLLSLEEEAEKLEDIPERALIKRMVAMVVDGFFNEELERISLMDYYSSMSDIYLALINIISIYGVSAVQSGMNPLYMLYMLNAMIPEDVRIEENSL